MDDCPLWHYHQLFVSCSDSDDDTDNAEQAKAIAGTIKVILLVKSKMFSDYLMGADARCPPL